MNATSKPDASLTAAAEAPIDRLPFPEPAYKSATWQPFYSREQVEAIIAADRALAARAVPLPAEVEGRFSDMRSAFERSMSDDGKWPRAVERTSEGGYLLAATASAWRTWQDALRARDSVPNYGHEAGMSWGGFNLYGDNRSISEAKRLLHLANQTEELRVIVAALAARATGAVPEHPELPGLTRDEGDRYLAQRRDYEETPMTDALQQGAAPTEPALSPCVFCGAAPFPCRHFAHSNRWGVTCQCGACGPTVHAGVSPTAVSHDAASTEAIAAWNRRATTSAPAAPAEPLKTGRTMLERAWDGFQNRNCGKREWRGKAQSKRDAFCNAVLDLLEWITEEADALRAATPQQAPAAASARDVNGINGLQAKNESHPATPQQAAAPDQQQKEKP